MTTSNFGLPQEWPEHLAPDAAVSPAGSVPPTGEPLLDFAAMSSTTFEQFCWWLLKKDHRLVGCMRLGGGKTTQGGIDLLAFDEQQPDKLHVFECKTRKNFNPAALKEAVDAFLEGDWSETTIRFTIILAQQVASPALLRQWKEDRQRLRKAGIDGELWTAHELTLKVQSYPDILSKFFPWPGVAPYANIWMQRFNFYELASTAFFDRRERVARWARELMQSSGDPATSTEAASQYHADSIDARRPSLVIDGTYRRISQFGNSWHFKGPWFSLSAILPDQRFTHASAAITFNRPDMQGMTLTVDHEWLLRRFLFREGAPLTSRSRGFIVGTTPQTDDQYLVDLPHCRLSLQAEGAEEIAAVADLLTDAMRQSLLALETAWSAVDFPFVAWSGKKVALGAIGVDAWQEIGRFAEEHDVSKGNTPWHMFEGDRQMLKPYHETGNGTFDPGYHGLIQAAEIKGLSHRGEVILLWQPNDLLPDPALSPRGWWPCDFAYQWVSETLLPEVRRHVHERCFGNRWKRLFRSRDADALAAYLDERFVVRDLRRRPLLRDGSWSAGIVESAQTLQSFFHNAGSPEPYILQREMENLYRAVAIVARGHRGYVGYAGSKLCLSGRPADHADLIDMVHDHIGQGRVVPNSSMTDSLFGAMLEMLDGSDAWLPDADRATIRDYIAPFARLRDDATLVHRHTKWG